MINIDMKQNSCQKLSIIALASLSAGIFLSFPALASNSTATSKDLLAQTTPTGPSGTPSTPSRSTPTMGSPSDSPGTPSPPTQNTPSDSSDTPSTPTRSRPSDSSGSSSSPSQTNSPASTPAKDSQAVKDPNIQLGGWTCLNNPNPQCRQP